ncbi:high affinity choline transporter 1-like isoform X2 [Lampetra planeri]
MALNVAGVVAVLVFYIIILVTGVWAARRSRATERGCQAGQSEMAMVGDRKMSVVVGVFTATATWVGGSYINGTAEVVYTPGLGLAWSQFPLGCSLSLFFGALFFAKPMRMGRYVTMLDPFQIRYGKWLGSLFYIPTAFGDLFWATAVLTALGSTISVILDIDRTIAVIVSAFITIIYTLLGGLYSVAYTDIIQLVFMVVGLVVCVPFAMMNPAVKNIGTTLTETVYQEPWRGRLETRDITRWIDNMLYMTLGNIPWQGYFQRVLAAESGTHAQVISFMSAFNTLLLAIPSVLIGAVAVSTDWNMTTYGLPSPHERGEEGMILPIVLQHICPNYIAIMGIGVLAAAVMSSADSALLSAGSLFTRNVYTQIIRPQLCLVLFLSASNGYGLIVAFFSGLLFRLTGGEPLLSLPALIRYPGYHEVDGLVHQALPMKTIAMLISLTVNVAVSFLTRHLFVSGTLPGRWDFLKEFTGPPAQPRPTEVLVPDSDKEQLEMTLVADEKGQLGGEADIRQTCAG